MKNASGRRLLKTIGEMEIPSISKKVKDFLNSSGNFLIIYETELRIAVEKDFFYIDENKIDTSSELYSMEHFGGDIRGNILTSELQLMISDSSNIFFMGKNESGNFIISSIFNI